VRLRVSPNALRRCDETAHEIAHEVSDSEPGCLGCAVRVHGERASVMCARVCVCLCLRAQAHPASVQVCVQACALTISALSSARLFASAVLVFWSCRCRRKHGQNDVLTARAARLAHCTDPHACARAHAHTRVRANECTHTHTHTRTHTRARAPAHTHSETRTHPRAHDTSRTRAHAHTRARNVRVRVHGERLPTASSSSMRVSSRPLKRYPMTPRPYLPASSLHGHICPRPPERGTAQR
jgi:hypothetical protein